MISLLVGLSYLQIACQKFAFRRNSIIVQVNQYGCSSFILRLFLICNFCFRLKLSLGHVILSFIHKNIAPFFFTNVFCYLRVCIQHAPRQEVVMAHVISWLTHESIATFFSGIACLYNSTEKLAWFTDLKNRTGSNNSLFVMSRFSNQLAAILERPPKARCLQANHTARLPKQVQNADNMFSQTTLNVNITKLFSGLHSIILLLPTAAILEISGGNFVI